MAKLFDPLTLPNGTILPNRLCKAAMEENMADYGQVPSQKLFTLYEKWAQSGVGLILTGNVMIDPSAMTGPGGVVLERGTDLALFKSWVRHAKIKSSDKDHSIVPQIWMQISHPGRQLYKAMEEQAVSASDIKLNIPGLDKMMAHPRALESIEIENLIERFAITASLAESAGFDGVQIHGAHGYLINQFLSPLTNQRNDQWGGSLENRARFLLETVQAVRKTVSNEFCVSVKLNSADFQKGGFDLDNAKWVVAQLNMLNIDLVELSGGSYESPAMQGVNLDKVDAPQTSSEIREAYFVEFAKDIVPIAKMPIMVTGGITKRIVAERALNADANGFGVDMLGIARAMAYVPDLPSRWQNDEALAVKVQEVSWKNKGLASLASMAMAKAQLERVSLGKKPKAKLSPIAAIISDQLRTKKRVKRYRRWRDQETV